MLLVFALFGDDLLRVIGVSLYGVRVGGGVLLLLLSIDIVFGYPIGPPAGKAEVGTGEGLDVAILPIATPILAGPGAITATIVEATEAKNGLLSTALLLVGLALVMLLTLVGLLAASLIERGLGHTGVNVLTRILGILLAAVSAEMILAGLRDSGVFR